MNSPTPPPPSLAEVRAEFARALLAGKDRVQREVAPSTEDVAEERDLDEERIRYEMEKASLANQNERALIGLRRAYGENMISFLWCYFTTAMTLILMDGFPGFPFDLPEAVQVALIGGTAVSVLGVVGTIVAGLFKVKP